MTEETREAVQSRKVLHFNIKKKCYTSLKENLESCFFFHYHSFQVFTQSFISWKEISCCEYIHLGLSSKPEKFNLYVNQLAEASLTHYVVLHEVLASQVHVAPDTALFLSENS